MPEQHEFIAFFKDALANNAGLSAPNDYERRYPNYQINDWSKKVNGLLTVLELLNEKFPTPESI